MTEEPDLTVIRLDRPGIRKVLGDLEAEIMELVWARPVAHGTTVRDIFEVLYERRHLAYTTVMSTMTRLTKKHLLRVVTQDQAYLYYPVLTEQQFIARFVGSVLEDLLVSFSGPTLDALQAIPDANAAARARALLEGLAQRRAAEEDA